MDAYLAIVSRREARSYDGRPIPDDAKRRILEAGRLAGSSRNRQQRRFVVIESAREAVAGAVWSPGNVRDAALIVAIVTSGKGPLALDAGRAAQNMLLAAHALGIGSCPNGAADAEALAAAVGAREGEQVATVLSFGYPSRPRDPERRSPEEWIERADRLPFDAVVSER
jgi:nitroreductase